MIKGLIGGILPTPPRRTLWEDLGRMIGTRTDAAHVEAWLGLRLEAAHAAERLEGHAPRVYVVHPLIDASRYRCPRCLYVQDLPIPCIACMESRRPWLVVHPEPVAARVADRSRIVLDMDHLAPLEVDHVWQLMERPRPW